MLRTLLLAIAALLPLAGLAQTQVPTSQAQISLSFAPLVREAAPAVVNIYARRIVERRNPFMDDPFFDGLFRNFNARPEVQNSLGSGVILSEDGILVSNYHVVGMATDIRVVLNDRREFDARVLLGDEESDLAILQLQGAGDLPHLSLRDSDTVEVGELVLAIGNPFGVGQTVSSGIVSGLARSGTASGSGRGYFIQTDAPINPGNSGGALIDVTGRLIGINTSILTRSGGSNGIGFAIPAALVAQFVNQARTGNTVFQRPWAGVRGQIVDADLAEGLGLERPGGVLLAELHPQSPFAEAGLESGDVVTHVDGLPVNTPAEKLFRMSIRGVGAQADVIYLRRGRIRTARVTMVAPPNDPPRDEIVLGDSDVLTGLRLARVNPALIAELGLPLGAEGIVVLETGRLGARAGLEVGDIILGIDGRRVADPREVGPRIRRGLPVIQIDALRDGQRVVMRFRV